MKSHIRLAGPQPYNIDATDDIKQRRRYHKINNWNWLKVREVASFCAEAHLATSTKLGPPKNPIPWRIEGGCIPLIRDFGWLMHGNGDFRSPVYTYVRCPDDVEPTTQDFCLEGFPLPAEEDCKNGIIYVPSGWCAEVISMIEKGVYLIKYSDDACGPLAYLTNGNVCSLDVIRRANPE